jgi:hypothetical protein
MDGYPLTPNLAVIYLFCVASTLATLTSPLTVVAKADHSGANLWQCPHLINKLLPKVHKIQ